MSSGRKNIIPAAPIHDQIIKMPLPHEFTGLAADDMTWKPLNNQFLAITSSATNKTSLLSFETKADKNNNASLACKFPSSSVDIPQAAKSIQSFQNFKFATVLNRHITLWDLSKIKEKTISRDVNINLPADHYADPTLSTVIGKYFIFFDPKILGVVIFNTENNTKIILEGAGNKNTEMEYIVQAGHLFAIQCLEIHSTVKMRKFFFIDPSTSSITDYDCLSQNETVIPSCFFSPNNLYYVIFSRKNTKDETSSLLIYRKCDSKKYKIAQVTEVLDHNVQATWLPDNTLLYTSHSGLNLFDPEELSIRTLYIFSSHARPKHLFAFPDGNCFFMLENNLVKIVTKDYQIKLKHSLSNLRKFLSQEFNGIKGIVDIILEYNSFEFGLLRPSFQASKRLPKAIAEQMMSLYYSTKLSHSGAITVRGLNRYIDSHPTQSFQKCVDNFSSGIGFFARQHSPAQTTSLFNKISSTKQLLLHESTSSESEKDEITNRI